MSDTQISEVHQSEGGEAGRTRPSMQGSGPGPESLGPACPMGTRAGLPVAVEAERDTGADEGHPLLGSLADKSSHAHRHVGGKEQREG